MLELGRQGAVAVTAVQPSERTFVRPAELIMGSTVNSMPGEYDAFAGTPDMDDVELVVEQPAQAVAAEVADQLMPLDEGLDGGADVAGGGARPDHRDAFIIAS